MQTLFKSIFKTFIVCFVVTSHAAVLEQAEQYLMEGKSAEAISILEKERRNNPNDARIILISGVAYAMHGDQNKAKELFVGLTKTHPTMPEAYNNLAALSAQQNKWAEARGFLEQALNTHPSYALAFKNLQDTYSQMAGDAYQKALTDSQTASAAPKALTLMTRVFEKASNRGSTVLASTSSHQITQVVQPATATSPAQVSEPVVTTVVNDVTQVVASNTNTLSEAFTNPEPLAIDPPIEVVSVAQPKPVVIETVPVAAAPAIVEPSLNSAPQQNASGSQQVNVANDILKSVTAWAQAWSNKDVLSYLSKYSPDFVLPTNLNKDQWVSSRTKRLSKPGNISVKLQSIEVKLSSNTLAFVDFTQEYASANYSDQTQKRLIMEKNGDRWLIKQETSK